MQRLRALKHIILYGSVLAALVFFLKWLQWKFLIADHAIDIYIGLVALFFTGLGIWISSVVTAPKSTVVIEKEVTVPPSALFVPDGKAVDSLQLNNREYEVLQLLAKGHSNQEIADSLYLSLSTIKTHVSNLYAKMGVKRRTQAVEKAKRLNIIP